MKKEYHFSKARRGAVASGKGKTRITIYLDDDVLAAFRTLAEKSGRGYQTIINEALGEYLANAPRPVDAATLRRILREELKKFS
ncbi:MAG: BrnA antitoxin family protein [Gammaproteobacteria bacterium]